MPYQLLQFSLLKNLYHTKLSVKTGLTDNFSSADTTHCLTKYRRIALVDLIHPGIKQKIELGIKHPDKFTVLLQNSFGLRPFGKYFTQDLSQGDKTEKSRRIGRVIGHFPVCKFHNPVHHSNGKRFATDRADGINFPGLPGRQIYGAFTVTIMMVFALFREKLNSSLKTSYNRIFQRITHGKKIKAAGK